MWHAIGSGVWLVVLLVGLVVGLLVLVLGLSEVLGGNQALLHVVGENFELPKVIKL